MNIFENFFKNLSSDSITDFFIITLTLVFVLGVIFFISTRNHTRKTTRKNFVEYAPNLLTSLGILGTFTGIIIGLLNFDISNIDTSISELLGGMKTAFLTSVIGVGLSILLKILYNFQSNKIKKEESKLDINNIIHNFYEQTELTKQQNQYFSEIVKSLGGDSESSIITQIKLLRNELTDQHKVIANTISPIATSLTELSETAITQKANFENFQHNLWKQLEQFAEMLSKSATEQVIEALKLVIVEFNQKLTEQFGDNFKQLNNAVGDLLKWQENYKLQLTEMIALYQLGVNSISNTEKMVTSIEESTNHIPETMKELEKIIQLNQQQIEQLNAHLNTFAEMRDNAVKAVPAIQENINSMLNNIEIANTKLISSLTENEALLMESISKSADELNNNTQQVNTVLVKNAENIAKKNDEMNHHLQDTLQLIKDKNIEFNTLLNNTSETLTHNAEKWRMEFERNVNSTVNNLNTEFSKLMNNQISENNNLMLKLVQEGENTLKTTQDSVTKQLKLIDDSMQAEITRVMEQMGSALATITAQFTQDYQKLVNQMARITQYRG